MVTIKFKAKKGVLSNPAAVARKNRELPYFWTHKINSVTKRTEIYTYTRYMSVTFDDVKKHTD